MPSPPSKRRHLRFSLSESSKRKSRCSQVHGKKQSSAKSFPVDVRSPRAAREAISALAGDLPDETLAIARLLVSELVANSVKHGPSGQSTKVGLYVQVERDRLRAEVSDGSTRGARLRVAGETGGYGLILVEALSTRWGSGRDGDLNVTWFKLGVPLPGT